ncbi:MAG: TonB-dependent receptor [Acidobacteria bacterium]|nr:TonB-dependent receptor [Acidobacteriota bacterium]
MGARVDRWELFGAETELSPRVGLAYHLPASRSVARFAYNRLFTPPPIEYVLLADFLGDARAGTGAGDVKPYTQHHVEAGWSQQVHRDVFLNLGAYRHTGENAFETTELSNSRLFLPTNFQEARANGVEVGVDVRPDAQQGLSGRVQYALAKVEFVAPISGGFAAEAHEPGEEIAPAFDQRHTLTSEAFYRHPWRHAQVGVVTRYGSGTPVERNIDVGGEEVEQIVRPPDHWTIDLSARIDLWRRGEQTVSFEFDVTNLTNNIYAIGKESEATPVQFAPRRPADVAVLNGRLTRREGHGSVPMGRDGVCPQSVRPDRCPSAIGPAPAPSGNE